jgi:polysaccharide export outer membrane protein
MVFMKKNVLTLRGGMALAMALIAGLSITGCTLPRNGPMLSEVQSANSNGDVVLSSVTREIARASEEPLHADFPAFYRDVSNTEFDRLVPGDGINVMVWERDGLGVFAANQSGVSDLGNMEIDRSGMLYLPMIGKFQAAGMTLAELHDAIVARLSKIIVASDVSVKRVDGRGQMVTVQGNLAKPGQYPITQTSQRLSSALALAAPLQTNPEQLAITIRRNNQVASVRLSDIYRNQDNDILLHAGDVITAHEVRDYLTVLGASGQPGRIIISKRNYSVLDALGDARGLDDKIADPRAVFLFSTRKLAPPDPNATENGAKNAAEDDRPTVFQFDLTRPEQVALAGKFSIQPGEAIFISDAPFTQVQKVLSAFRVTMGASFSATRAIDAGSGGGGQMLNIPPGLLQQ